MAASAQKPCRAGVVASPAVLLARPRVRFTHRGGGAVALREALVAQELACSVAAPSAAVCAARADPATLTAVGRVRFERDASLSAQRRASEAASLASACRAHLRRSAARAARPAVRRVCLKVHAAPVALDRASSAAKLGVGLGREHTKSTGRTHTSKVERSTVSVRATLGRAEPLVCADASLTALRVRRAQPRRATSKAHGLTRVRRAYAERALRTVSIGSALFATEASSADELALALIVEDALLLDARLGTACDRYGHERRQAEPRPTRMVQGGEHRQDCAPQGAYQRRSWRALCRARARDRRGNIRCALGASAA